MRSVEPQTLMMQETVNGKVHNTILGSCDWICNGPSLVQWKSSTWKKECQS